MEVKIGVQHASRELVIDSDESGDQLESTVANAVSGGEDLLVLKDTKGRKVMVPTDKLAYVELGSPALGQVGFRT